MKQWMKGLLACVISFAVIAVVKDHVALVHSATNSLPYKYFLKIKTISPSKRDYTCVEVPWYGGKIIKEVIGVPGDLLTYDTSGVLTVGDTIIGKPRVKAKDGRALTPIQSGAIPEGYVFLKGSHDRSFDSRYQEMGLVHKNRLEGKAIGLV